MNPNTPLNMMSPFDMAWDILKSHSAFIIKSDAFVNQLLKMGKFEDARDLQAMRQFVLDNTNSPDPQKRAAAEEMYQHLTKVMSYVGGGNRSGQPTPQIGEIPGWNAEVPISSSMESNIEPDSSMAGAGFPVGVKPPETPLPEQKEEEDY